jgi:hypothetical protein
VVVAVPESSTLVAGEVVPQEVEAITIAFERLLGEPDVDQSKAGIVGFSVGGSLSIVAATQPRIRDRVRFVNTLGSYYDAATLLVDVASATQQGGNVEEPWSPDQLPREVLIAQVIDSLPLVDEREALRARVNENRPIPPDVELSDPAEIVLELLDKPTRWEARELVTQLPASVQQRLRLISPSTFIDDLRAKLYLMHDTGDRYVPYSHLDPLMRAAPKRGQITTLSSFAHVTPNASADPRTVLSDAGRLFLHVREVLSEV